jgi:hypothetical protein
VADYKSVTNRKTSNLIEILALIGGMIYVIALVFGLLVYCFAGQEIDSLIAHKMYTKKDIGNLGKPIEYQNHMSILNLT